MSEEVVQITTFVHFIENQLAPGCRQRVNDGPLPTSLARPGLEQLRCWRCSSVLGKTCARIISKAELHAIRVKFGHELDHIKDADRLVSLPVRQVVTLISASRANAVWNQVYAASEDLCRGASRIGGSVTCRCAAHVREA